MVPFVLEVMVVVGLTAYLFYRHEQESVGRVAHRLMAEVSDRVEQHLNQYLEGPVNLTDEVATTIEIGVLNWQDVDKLERYFKSRLQMSNRSNYSVNSMLLVDRQKNLLGVETLNPNQWSIYKRNAATNQQIHSQSLTLEGDQPRSHYEIQFAPTQDPFQERSWYATVNEADQGLWRIRSLLGVEQSRLVLTYLRSFSGDRPTPQGVVGASIDLEQISKFLQMLEISHQGQAFILEPSGAIVSSSQGEPFTLLQSEDLLNTTTESLLDAVAPEQRSRLQATRSNSATIRHAAQHLAQELGAANRITQPLKRDFETEGKAYFLQVAPLKNPRNLNWVLVVAVPKADFAAQLSDHRQSMIFLFGGALLGAIALGLLTAQQITRPILRLSRASQALMLDKLDQPVEEQSWITELAIMAHSFNRMTDQLMKSFDQVKLALQESTEKFTTVFRTSPDPIMVTTFPDGKILEVNDSFLRLTGYTRETVIHSTASQLGLWSNQEERQKLVQIIQETGRIYNQEVRTITQNGAALTVLISAEKIELDGKPCLLTVAKDITERKRLEEALRQSEAKLQDVLDSVAAAICYFYIDDLGSTQAIYFSAGAEAVFGLSPTILLEDQRAWQSRVYLEDWQTIVSPCLTQVATGKSMAIEYRYHHPNGSLCWISADIITRWDSTQNRRLVTSVEFDITARKQSEEALRLSEERFRAAFDSASIGMDIADQEGYLIQVNPALCQMLGYSEAELLQRSYRDLTHPDDLFADATANLRILRGEVASQTFEKRFIHKDGQTIWALLSLALVRDLEQKPLYWVAQVQDISTRKQVEEALRDSEARFRAVFETASVGIAIANLDGKIVEANDTFCRICGYFKTELRQMQLQELIHPDDQRRWLRLVQELDTQWLDHYQLKVCFIRKDQEFRWVQLTTLLIRDSDRHPLYRVVRVEILPITSVSESANLNGVEFWQH